MSGPGSPPRRVVVVGGVAGGMSAATRLRRLDEDADIVVLERSAHVSYANCGLPYFVGGVIEEEDSLLLQTPERLFERFRLDVRVNTEALAIDPAQRRVRLATAGGAVDSLRYDMLVLSPGAAAVRPPLPGFHRAHVLRTVEDAERLAVDAMERPRSAVVVGAGFVGLETAENLTNRGIPTTVVEQAPQVLSPLDPELAVLVAAELVRHGVRVETRAAVAEVTECGVTLADGRQIPGDLVVAAVGVRPDVRLAEMAGLAIGPNGGISVDGDGRTSDPYIYAVGDAVEKADLVGGGSSIITLANVANRQGRRVADHIAGRRVRLAPSQGTAIVKVFDLVAAVTGWNEARLRQAGRPYRVVRSHPANHASYYPGAEQMSLKLLFDAADGTILGAQAVGGAGVDKRIDVLATAITGGLRAEELADLELAYAPPFSSAKDPINMLGYMAENILSGDCDVVETDEIRDLQEAGWTLLDVRTASEYAAGAIPDSVHVPLDELRERVDELRGAPCLVYCEVGQRGHTATRLLHELGHKARNLNGGYRTWRAVQAASAGEPSRLL
ncbi:CoA-disulfide reductase [Acidimicrobiaceae bacterium USS-CC1]|uniref:CoA-disulfide reductase n=1 Tax=Acidiferrimicrobium australe TaxID=2664430 RepID=A0ABW9QQF1_9ACTN|nr:CoA-disulfide reductase [Acidiferrimicrobium australe]